MEHSVELWGARTGNSLRAAIALEEAGVSYEVKHVDLRAKQHQTPEYLTLNPVGQVPVLVSTAGSNRLLLPQSNAIMFFAAETGPNRLLPPSGTPEYFLALERYFYFLTDVISASGSGFILKSQGSADGERLYERVVERSNWADRFLTETPYLAGNQFTLADIAAYTIIWAFRDRFEWASVPNLKRWYELVGSRPAVKRGMHIFDQPAAT